MREASAVYTVREAKARLSELIRLAGQGTDVTITSHGQPVARVGPVGGKSGKPFLVDFDWLRSMPVSPGQTPAEQIIREDRDARG
jgi:prevent-host-death family protein